MRERPSRVIRPIFEAVIQDDLLARPRGPVLPDDMQECALHDRGKPTTVEASDESSK